MVHRPGTRRGRRTLGAEVSEKAAIGKILVTARSFRKVPGPHQQLLKDAGYELLESPHDRPLEPGELASLLPGVDGVILGVDAVPAAVLEHADRLKVLSRCGVGVDGIDLQAATARGIVVTTTPGANSLAVAELTIALMLALLRHIPHHDMVVRQGGWERRMGSELAGSTLGLVGLGRIGREVARRAHVFDMRLLFADPDPPPEEAVRSLGADPRDLPSLLSESDIVSLHLPLNGQTQGIIGVRELECMKVSGILVNTSRGGLVDEQALYAALSQGRLAGAACDVFSEEPPRRSPLLKLDNFIATPHIGSNTLQTALRMGLMASRNALTVLEGGRPEHVANPEVYAAKND